MLTLLFSSCSVFTANITGSGSGKTNASGNGSSLLGKGDNSELKVNPFSIPEDEVSQTLEDYIFDLSKIKFWKKSADSAEDSGTYNA